MVISWLYIKNKTRLFYPKSYCFLTRLSAYMEILVDFTWNHLLARMSCWVLTRAISLVQLQCQRCQTFSEIQIYTLTQWFSNCRAHLTGDSNKDCLCIACVGFVKPESLCEDLLFCRYIQSRATDDELFELLDWYLTEHGLKWENCVSVCTDGAQTMAGKRRGLHGLIKRVSPNAKGTNCVIHRQALASKQLSPELNKVLADVVNVLNFMKTRPLRAQLFSALCEEMGAQHSAVLFHSEARWLWQGQVLPRVFELREEIRVFSEEEKMHELAIKLSDELFLMKLAYLSDVFGKLN